VVTSADFDSLHEILPGKHFYQFYKNSEDFFSVMIPFFQAGLEKREACLWLVSQKNGLDSALTIAQATIPQFSNYVSTGQFQILSAEDWYLTDGSFDEAKAINHALEYLETIQKKGFQQLRGSGDGGVILRRDWPLVEAYEKKMGPWIKENHIVALCAYPILECTPSQTKGILDCHEDVLVGKI